MITVCSGSACDEGCGAEDGGVDLGPLPAIDLIDGGIP